MKLRNLIFSLFLAIGAIGFTACTGDDGAQGPQGPPGEQGPPGDPGEGAGAVEYNYSFLPSWGQASGKVACDDPLLTSDGVFPGPASLMALETPARVNAACPDTIFNSIDPDLDGDGSPDGTATVGLVFQRTHAGAADPEMTPVAPQGDASPRLITTNKNFAGGIVLADLVGTGASDEAFARAQLYHDCGVGTVPSMIKGEWRAVRIVEVDVVLEVEDDNTNANFGSYVPVLPTAVTTTTQKVCVRLDSLPGAVKCYYTSTVAGTRTGVTAGTTEQIGIYRDAELHAVVPMANATSNLVNPQSATADINILGLDLDNSGTVDASDDSAAGALDASKLCNLLEEAAPTS